MRSRTHATFLDTMGISTVTVKMPLISVLFPNRRFVGCGCCESHLSPCLTFQVEEMGNPFKKLVLKFSDSPRSLRSRSSSHGHFPFLS